MEVPRRKKTQVVCALIENVAGRVFVAKRPEGKSLGGYWEFPGGKIDEGESPKMALAREIEEELCVTIKVGDSLPVSEHDYDYGAIKLLPFKSEIVNGNIYLNEHSEYRWVEKSHLLDLKLAPADIPIARFLASE